MMKGMHKQRNRVNFIEALEASLVHQHISVLKVPGLKGPDMP